MPLPCTVLVLAAYTEDQAQGPSWGAQSWFLYFIWYYWKDNSCVPSKSILDTPVSLHKNTHYSFYCLFIKITPFSVFCSASLILQPFLITISISLSWFRVFQGHFCCSHVLFQCLLLACCLVGAFLTPLSMQKHLPALDVLKQGKIMINKMTRKCIT